MVGVVTKLLMPTCEGEPSRNPANEFANAPYRESAGPLADIVTPGPKNAAPFAPYRLLQVGSIQPSAWTRRRSAPNFTLWIELCQLQFHTRLKMLSTGFSGTQAGAPIGARPVMLIPI